MGEPDSDLDPAIIEALAAVLASIEGKSGAFQAGRHTSRKSTDYYYACVSKAERLARRLFEHDLTIVSVSQPGEINRQRRKRRAKAC
ncbi:hypothetical protein I6F35_02415 [Bradyrhizobium sp. BRP22]|uniref:hypothetical protein n=1 Tax=Bradyrhizobium sp. BRP22 TaxID=2793821 RepID=UPI001CD7B520|nr:hypothetical protein [Bradyrhizobium sp. BRP22]MCA1452069.1 hypothetical protein [Bradyrhizobium sp. BRP22]